VDVQVDPVRDDLVPDELRGPEALLEPALDRLAAGLVELRRDPALLRGFVPEDGRAVSAAFLPRHDFQEPVLRCSAGLPETQYSW